MLFSFSSLKTHLRSTPECAVGALLYAGEDSFYISPLPSPYPPPADNHRSAFIVPNGAKTSATHAAEEPADTVGAVLHSAATPIFGFHRYASPDHIQHHPAEQAQADLYPKFVFPLESYKDLTRSDSLESFRLEPLLLSTSRLDSCFCEELACD
jgi:hypothetical protein